MALKYQRGTILLIAQVPDQNNTNHKDRSVVLIRDFDEEDSALYGVAVTSTFDYPLPSTSVLLPYHRQGRCKTGQTKECVAVCTWLVEAGPGDIVKRIGATPGIVLNDILREIANQLPPETPPAAGTGN